MNDLLLEIATEAAAQSADLLVGAWADRSVLATKSSATDVVTQMDRDSEALLVETIRGVRPDDAVVGEEGGERDGATGVTWVIDPLDGTVNYLYGLPVWAVSVGVLVDGEPTVGVVHAPALGCIWRGVAGEHPLAEANGSPIEPSGCSSLDRALVGTGFGYEAHVRSEQGRVLAQMLGEVRDVRRAGAAAVDMCWVAQGRLDAYFERGTHLWDRAAATAICRAVGITVGGIDGGTATDGMTIAANRELFDPLRALLVRAGA